MIWNWLNILLLKDFRFRIFSKEVKQPTQSGNIVFIPVDKEAFNKSLINCKGIITGAGFETPAEAYISWKKINGDPYQTSIRAIVQCRCARKIRCHFKSAGWIMISHLFSKIGSVIKRKPD